MDPYLSLSSNTQILAYNPTTSLCLTNGVVYVNGSCINTIYYSQNLISSPNTYNPNFGILTFPAKFYNKKCIPDSPVKYLHDVPKSFCEMNLSEVNKIFIKNLI